MTKRHESATRPAWLQRVGVWGMLGLVLMLTPQSSLAQRRPPRQKPTTATDSREASENAQEKRERQMWNDLEADRSRHLAAQDKATRKRMKRSIREARRQGRNRVLPWWKRVFSRKRYD
jgi:hypothetical protein